MSFPFDEHRPYGREVSLQKLMDNLREASERDVAEPLDEQVDLLRKSMYERVRDNLPYGEFLPRALVRELARGLYEYRFDTIEEGGAYKLRCTATLRKDRRLRFDPEKVVVIKADQREEPVGVVVSEGAFWIEEFGP